MSPVDVPPPPASARRGFGIADVCVDRPVFATMLSMALVVLGAISYTRLGVDVLPDVEQPQVTVFTALPGAGPEEVESTITQPIEEQLNTIAGINEMRSINREGFSFVILTFGLERPIAEAVQDVRDKLSRIVRQLPEGTDPPVISTFDAESSPIFSVAISGPQSLRELTDFAETRAKDAIGTAIGVGQVNVEGGQLRALNIIVDAARLQALGLTALDVKNAVQSQNVEIPGGRVTRNAREDVLRTMARIHSAAELETLVVKSTPGQPPVLLRDVARVEDGTTEVRGTSRMNGKAAVTLSIQKQSGANVVETARAVKARLKALEPSLPAGAEMIILRDASVFVEDSVAEARFHLLGGALLAALVVLFFMGSWRSTIIAGVAIPASVIATFTAMRAFDFTLNNITLLAMTLAVGIVIDDAIVVVENIHRFIHEKRMQPAQAAKEATREIALAVSATTLSLVVIFLPIAFMEGQIGRLFQSYGVTVAVAVVVSLFVAFTLTPMLASRILEGPPVLDEHGNAPPPAFLERFANRVMTPLENVYGKAVAWSLDHRLVVVILSLLITATAVPLYRAAPFEFMPEDDQSEFEISVEMPTGTSFSAADDVMRELEQQLAQLNGVKDVLSSIGDARGTGSTTRASIYVGLVPIDERDRSQEEIMNSVRPLFQRYPDLRITVRSLRTAQFGGGGYGGKLRVFMRGPDLQKLEENIQKLLVEMRQDPSFVDVNSTSLDRLPEMRVVPDRQKAADLGVTAGDIAETLRILVGGDIVSSFRDGDERYDIWLRADLSDRDGKEDIGRIPLRTRTGELVPLDNLATVTEALGPTLVLRLNGGRQVFVSSNPAPGVSLDKAVARATAIIEKLNLPPGYDYGFLGDVQTLDETRSEFILALLLSLIFVYMVLAAQFESFLHPVTILLSLPLTAPFALLSLLLLNETINVYSVFGLFMLFGIVKKNGILQVDYTNALIARGVAVREAILEANRARLRPILMTSVTLVAAMAPMTFAEGPGAASRASLAKVIVGGQTLSLVITLLIVPVAYSYFDDAQRWFKKKRGR